MGRFSLILFTVWAAFAYVQMADVDSKTFFWASLLPATYFVGMFLLRDRDT